MINIATKKTGVRGIVSLAGSIKCGKRYWQGNALAPEGMTAMLLSGTKTRDKKTLNDTLENSAISISFLIDDDYLDFVTTIPVGKEKLFLELFTDMLANSVFPKDEFTMVVERIRASILEASTDPADVAFRALSRALFPKGKIQHKLSSEERLKLLGKLTLHDVIEAHRTLVGLSEINIAITGDVDDKFWQKEAKAYFSKLPKKAHRTIPELEALDVKDKSSEDINIKDKTSVNAYWAIPIIIDVNSRAYLALKCALRVLGGDFVSRLMSEVRAKRGLTYHIASDAQGIARGDAGLFYIEASFAPILHDKGMKATEEVIGNFFANGIKQGEFERVKNAIAGEYEVRLATSRGMASELLNCLELARPVSYIQDFPKLIKSVTMKDVKEILASLKTKKFYRVSAGSIGR